VIDLIGEVNVHVLIATVVYHSSGPVQLPLLIVLFVVSPPGLLKHHTAHLPGAVRLEAVRYKQVLLPVTVSHGERSRILARIIGGVDVHRSVEFGPALVEQLQCRPGMQLGLLLRAHNSHMPA
jgi:hypothetical protein